MQKKSSEPVLVLIERCLVKGNKGAAAWRDFRKCYDPLVRLYLSRQLFSRSYAYRTKQINDVIQDLCQEVYMKLLLDDAAALCHFRGATEKSFRCFLNTICTNTTINFLRAKHTNRSRRANLEIQSEPDEENVLVFAPSTNETEEYLDAIFLIEEAVAILRKKYKSRDMERDIAIFKLFYFEKLTSNELVELNEFGLKKSGIETLVSRMKKILQKEFSDF